MLIAVSVSALMTSAGFSLGLAASPFLSVVTALISVFVGLLQSIGRSVSTGCMSGGVSGVGLLILLAFQSV